MMLIVFTAAAIHFAYAVACGFRQPIACDLHAFRGSQTAIGAWSVMRTGRCEVPVLGPGSGGDWRICFEWPLYQRCVAAVAPLFGGK